jgi:hypothetical protein
VFNSGSSDGMPPGARLKGKQELLAGGYSSSFFSLGFFLELERKVTILAIKFLHVSLVKRSDLNTQCFE